MISIPVGLTYINCYAFNRYRLWIINDVIGNHKFYWPVCIHNTLVFVHEVFPINTIQTELNNNCLAKIYHRMDGHVFYAFLCRLFTISYHQTLKNIQVFIENQVSICQNYKKLTMTLKKKMEKKVPWLNAWK